MSSTLGTRRGVSVVSGWTPLPDTWQSTASRLSGVLTLFTAVVTDSVDTGMLQTYIYTQHM